MLYLPPSIKLPESLERVSNGQSQPEKGQNQAGITFLRFVASIREGRLTAREGLQRLGSAAKGDTVACHR
jgi:hypothetical protein